MRQFVIVQPSDQLEPQPKTSSPVPVSLRHDAKDFQMPNHVLHTNPFACQFSVGLLVQVAQLAALRLFHGRLRVFVFALQALIPSIRQYFGRGGNSAAALLEHFVIVPLPAPLLGTNYFTRPFVHDYLRLDCVSLLFARIVPPLFFFGRSISVSVTSTTTTSIW